MSLFGAQPIGSTNGNRHYVEMKAGKMTRQGTWVYPEKRKGLLYIYQNSEALMHFCWRSRETNDLEDDLIIFPGDCSYSRVRQCTTGRVYVLKFNNSPVRLFYWLQEPKTDKDDEHCKRINYLLNHPPVPVSVPGMYVPYMLSDMSQEQLSRIFGPSVAATLSSLLNQAEGPGTSANANQSASKTSVKSPEVAQHNTTPTSGGSSKSDVRILDRKKSNLKTPALAKGSENENKKREKSVTILENVKTLDESEDGENGDDEKDDNDDEEEDED